MGAGGEQKEDQMQSADETMNENDLASNAMTIIHAIEKKLPNGDKNFKKFMIKTTMGKAIKIEQNVRK